MKKAKIIVLALLAVGIIMVAASGFFPHSEEYFLAYGLVLFAIGILFSSYVFFRSSAPGRSKETNEMLSLFCVVVSFFAYVAALIPFEKILPRQSPFACLIFLIPVSLILLTLWLHNGNRVRKQETA